MFGSHAAFCRKIGISRVAAYNWKKHGVPPERALQIEIMTNGAITRQDLRPDLFGLTALQQ